MKVFVLVEFDSTPRIYYIGQIVNKRNKENEFEISYLRKNKKISSFMFPVATDLPSVKFEDIKRMLEKTKKCGTTKRQNSNLVFNVMLENLYIK